ncbi:hypothetical protein PSTG_17856, partial [Puccinia striiformis f. sp. tritici PST-78]
RAELGALISSNSRAEPCPPSSSERDERVELRRPELDERGSKPRALHQSGRDERTGSEFSGKLSDSCGPERVELPGVHGAERDEQSDAEFCAELRGAVAANPQPTYVRAPQTPSTPAGLTRYFTPRGPYLQRSFESPSESAYQKGSVSLQPQRPTSTPASSSAAARRPLPCSTPTRWKLGEIQEEEENSPTGGQHCPDLGGGNLLLEGRESDGKNSEKRKKKQYSEKKSPQSTQSSIESYLNFSHNPALEQLSDCSQKEFLLSNINNKIENENPFLIEDKLQNLFSIFLSELSGTIDAFPGTLLESCVEKLSSTINSSILELIKSEVTPMLLDNTLTKLRELGGDKKSPPSICQTDSLKDFINEKIDCLQDIIAINDGQQKTDIDIMRREFSEMEHRLFNNFSSITNQINDLSKNEDTRFEQVKRRIGAVNNQVENLNSEVHLLISNAHSNDREPPPHLKYNNPLMNSAPLSCHPIECSPNSQIGKAEATKQDVVDQRHSVVIEKESEPIAEALEEFPLINHKNVDLDMRRELWKGIPRTNEWEKFSGEYPYNHELWLKNTDVLVEDYLMLDHMVLSRMTTILTDSAK